MKLNLVLNSSVSSAPAGFLTAMQTAANIISAAFSNNVTINIKVGYGEITGSNGVSSAVGANSALGGPDVGFFSTFATVKNALLASSSSATDSAAYASLNIAQNPNNNGSLAVWRAQEKALGITTGGVAANDSGIDGEIGIGTGWSANQWVAVALHEITHAMGRTSGYASYGILDLFRFNAPGVHVYDGNTGATKQQYFSIDGGNTNLANYATTSDYGDLASDVLNDPYDAFAQPNSNSLTPLDLKIMDAIGFALAPTTYTVAQAVAAFSANSISSAIAVVDTAANISSGLDQLQQIAAASELGSVTVSGGGKVSVTAAQMTADAGALALIASPYAVTVTASSYFYYTLANNINNLTLVSSTGGTIIANGLTDTITGSAAGDVIYAKGVDTVSGGGGFDYLIELTPGVSLTYGGNFTGISEVITNVGNNIVDATGDTSQIFIYGSVGNDTLTLGSGGGFAFGGGGSNVLNGGANAANFLVDSGGTNVMNGGGGTATNFFYVNPGDTVNGAGAFNVMIELSNGVSISGLGTSNVQEVILNGGTNTVTGAGSSNFLYLYGAAGDDTLTLGSGGGYLFGLGGNNTLNGGTGGTNVFIGGSGGSDVMNGGTGTSNNVYYIDTLDTVHGAGAFNNVILLQQNVALTYGTGPLASNIQEVVLNGGTNSVDFSAANSTVYLYGASGNDTLKGGAGNDYLFGGAGANTFQFQIGWGVDSIQDWSAGTGNIIDMTALAALNIHSLGDITQTIVNGNDVITSALAGGNSITLVGVASALAAGNFHFA